MDAISSVFSQLAACRGAGNVVLINSDNLGEASLSGPGAGRYPTANSVVSDVVRLARGLSVPPFPYNNKIEMQPDVTGEFYTRITCRDGIGIIKRVGELASDNGVSIHAILQVREGRLPMPCKL